MPNNNGQETRMFPVAGEHLDKVNDVKDIMKIVFQALEEKGYRPVDQIVGYLVSGDPAYITSHRDARLLLRHVERDELLEKIVRYYLEGLQ